MVTVKQRYQVNRRDIMYLRTTIESYDGMVLVSTIALDEAVIELVIAPGCQGLVEELIEDLRKREKIRLETVGTP